MNLISRWETGGALGRLATKSLFFYMKRGEKCSQRVSGGSRDDECMILYTSKPLSDGDRQTGRQRKRENEWYQDARSGTEGSHWRPSLLPGSECGCVFVFVCVQFISLRKPFPKLQPSEASIGIRGPFHSAKSKSQCMLVYSLCVHVGGVCLGISATDEVLNYKAYRYGGIVCHCSVWVLSFYCRSQGDKTTRWGDTVT